MKPWVLVLAFFLVAGMFCGCAKKELKVEFRPLQLHWIAVGAEGEAVPNRDDCVIRLTGRLMGESLVQASAVEELSYRVEYGLSSDPAGVLHFEASCEEAALAHLPECRWSATCDASLDIVVKFHNGD